MQVECPEMQLKQFANKVKKRAYLFTLYIPSPLATSVNYNIVYFIVSVSNPFKSKTIFSTGWLSSIKYTWLTLPLSFSNVC